MRKDLRPCGAETRCGHERDASKETLTLMGHMQSNFYYHLRNIEKLL